MLASITWMVGMHAADITLMSYSHRLSQSLRIALATSALAHAPTDDLPDSPKVLLVSPNEFEWWLRAEMRRAERCHSTLCVATFDCSPNEEPTARAVEAIAARLQTTSPEVIASRRHGTKISILLPNTVKEDVLEAIQAADPSAVSPRHAEVYCYPDDVLASFVDGSDASELPFIMADYDERRSGLLLKRCLDVALVLVALTALSPLMVLTAIAVAATSRGPVLFRQSRIGRFGRRFVVYKFRSMYVDADERVHRQHVTSIIRAQRRSAADDEPPSYWKQLDDDPRITPLGRYLRRLKIDELPQLFNVLKGEMSIVGPRPALNYEAALYQPWQLRRMSPLKPGITGLWQVTGDSYTTFDDMVRMDLHYIDRWSNQLDLRILMATVGLLLLRLREPFMAKASANREVNRAPPGSASVLVDPPRN